VGAAGPETPGEKNVPPSDAVDVAVGVVEGEPRADEAEAVGAVLGLAPGQIKSAILLGTGLC
jgi:hypothetical protein